MKKCRHCRTDNDPATTCTECGLDLGPSTVAKFVARLPSAFRAIDTKWLWRALLIIALPILLLAAYCLSLGPILRFYGAKPQSVWNRVPSGIRVIYQPMDSIPFPKPLSRLLRQYNWWWMRVEDDKRKLINLMNQIDASITNGMSQNRVVALLGQPLYVATNGNTIFADYDFVPLGGIYYGSITSGFTITFSNNSVLCKFPIISGSN